jgi:hypothetical protein
MVGYTAVRFRFFRLLRVCMALREYIARGAMLPNIRIAENAERAKIDSTAFSKSLFAEVILK